MDNMESESKQGIQSTVAPEETETPSGIKLRCFQENAPPPVVEEGWRRLTRFPAETRDDFRTLLQSTLVRSNNSSNEQLIKQFCTKYSIDETDVIAALGSCNLLFRQAGMLNLDRSVFQKDLATLSEGDSAAGDFILDDFERVKALLRQQIILESLTDHGKVIVGLDWRVDDISASDRGTALDTKVVFLTLRYKDGDRQERITFQLTPKTVKELRNFCNRFSM